MTMLLLCNEPNGLAVKLEKGYTTQNNTNGRIDESIHQSQ